MQGMASNLTAKVEDQYAHGRFAHVTERAEAPIEEALSLIVRERLTGLKPPASAQALVDVWRPWVEERAATTLERMGEAATSQSKFGRLMRDMLRDQVAQFPAGTGFLLNAHNQHIAAEAHNLNHMGVLLREEWGKGFVAIGTAFSSGSVYAADWTQGPSNTFAVHHPGRAPLDTLDGALSLAGLPAFLIDLRQSPAPSPPGSIRRNGSASSAAATLVTHHLSSSSHLPGRTMP